MGDTEPSPIVVRDLGAVLFTVFDGAQAEADVDAYLDALTKRHGTGEPYLGLSLMLRYSSSPEHLRRIGDWMRAHREETSRLCVGSAILSPRPGFRFLLSSLFMIQRMPMPYSVSATPEEALAWLRGRASEAGLDVPADLERVVDAALAASSYGPSISSLPSR